VFFGSYVAEHCVLEKRGKGSENGVCFGNERATQSMNE